MRLIAGIRWVISLGAALIILIFLSIYELKSMDLNFLVVLWGNLQFISSVIFALLPLLIMILLFVLFLKKKWAFRVERLSIGGFNILFDNPSHLFKKQMRTYLDTKRTLFMIDLKHDNFNDTLDSYFEMYKVLKSEIKILGEISEKPIKRSKETHKLYELSNDMLKELNSFLTKHQSDYRRWYKYMELKHEDDFYLKPIGELQKEYGNYEEFCRDFQEINKFFVTKVSDTFNVNIEKWGIEDA
ncbi:hypothetical protein RZN22_16090 [Bacillaceae bacterium S4-13-58]